jgi:transposase
VRPPWEGLSGHFSREFEAFALLLMREMPVSRVAEVVGERDTRLWRMLFRHVDGAYAEADFSNVCCVGVDELNVRKGHEYISVFADLLAKRVLFATEGKEASTWERFVQALEAHNGHRHGITQVSMDMSQAYRSGVAQTCRNAQVVFDKFHVIAHANQAVDQARRAEFQLDRGARNHLRRSQWLWRKNPENLTPRRTWARPKPIRCDFVYRTSIGWRACKPPATVFWPGAVGCAGSPRSMRVSSSWPCSRWPAW